MGNGVSTEEAIDQAKRLQAQSKSQAALDLLERLHSETSDARLLDATASALYDLGRMAEARARRHQAIEMHREAGDKAGESGTLFLLGAMDAREGSVADGRKSLERCLILRREISDRAGMARALQQLGSLDLDEGRNGDARRHLEEALDIKRELGEEGTKAATLLTFHLGRLDLREGRHSAARPRFERWLKETREVGDRVGEASTLRILGTIDYVEDRPGDALEKLNQSLEVWQAQADDGQVATTLNSVATVATSIGDWARASAALARAYEIVTRGTDENEERSVVENIALLAWKRGVKALGMTLISMCELWGQADSVRSEPRREFAEIRRASGLDDAAIRAMRAHAAEHFRNQRGRALVLETLKTM